MRYIRHHRGADELANSQLTITIVPFVTNMESQRKWPEVRLPAVVKEKYEPSER